MYNNNNFSSVKLEVNGLSATISNSFLSVFFDDKACVYKLIIFGKNIVNNLNGKKTFCLDWDGGKGEFKPNNLNIVEYSDLIAHIYYEHKLNNYIFIEYHFIVRKYISGIYSYVNIVNNGFDSFSFSELRTVYRFDNSIMDRLNNGIIDMKSYLYSYLKNLPLIQDETWQLEDGSYYSKYDLSGYIRETDFYGVYGNGFGSWLVNFTHEYYSGGPLKQDLLVHQDSLMLNYLTSTHFGTPTLIVPKYWNKQYGPWLIYFNKGNNLFLDTKNFYNEEKKNWPFLWIKDKNYQFNRKEVKGKIKSNFDYTVVLSSSLNEYFDKQTLGYLYHTNINKNNEFYFKNVRPGKYNINIYPINGYDCNFKWQETIDIYYDRDIGIINLIEKEITQSNVIWSIGETNRRSDIFRFSLENRNYVWHTLVPKNLDFYIGKSLLYKDWYFCQASNGIWNIHFLDINDKKDRILNIGISGASNNILENTSPNLEVYLNKTLLKKFSYINDKSIYRCSLQSGIFHSEKIYIYHNFILNGLNIISLKLVGGSIMYDSINLCYV